MSAPKKNTKKQPASAQVKATEPAEPIGDALMNMIIGVVAVIIMGAVVVAMMQLIK